MIYVKKYQSTINAVFSVQSLQNKSIMESSRSVRHKFQFDIFYFKHLLIEGLPKTMPGFQTPVKGKIIPITGRWWPIGL
jgi:hypothetical protein